MDGVQVNRATSTGYSAQQNQQDVQNGGIQEASIFSGNKVKKLTREVDGIRQTIYVGKDQNGNKIRTDAKGNILITNSQFGKNTYITTDRLQQPESQPIPTTTDVTSEPAVEDKTTLSHEAKDDVEDTDDEPSVPLEPAPKGTDEPNTPFILKRPVQGLSPIPADPKNPRRVAPSPGDSQAPKPPHGTGWEPGRDNVKPKPPVKTQPQKPVTPKPLTPQERNTARHYGSNVSDYLVGYTDDSEKGLTKEVITHHVNNRNVMDFLAGYERNKGLGDHFFTQLGAEYGFEEKQNLMKNVAVKLSQYLKANGQPHLAREVDVALKDNGFSRQEMARMDEIVHTMLTTIPGLKV